MNEVYKPSKVRVSWKRWWIGCAFVVLCWVGLHQQAEAQTPGPNTAFQVQQFRPWADPQGIFQTQSGSTLGQWNYLVGLWFNYANDPLTERNLASGKRIPVLEHQLGLDLIGAIGLFNWLDFGFNLPMTLYQVGSIPDLSFFGTDRKKDLSGFALSDLKLFLKAQMLKESKHFINLGLQFYLGLPTGNKNNLNGEDGVSFGAQLNVSKHISIVNLGLNFGYRYLPPTTLANLKVQHELTYSLGAGFRVVKKYLDILADVSGAIAVSDVTTASSAPLELYLGARLFPLANENLAFTLGGSFAVSPGYGSPLFRILFGAVWSPKRRDKDGDGIVDSKDRCPTVPGPRANQGCPWPDTDGDGLKDNVDKCPKKPGPKENKGCPWGDRDGDGLKDNVDKCPDKAGPKENKGCPWGDRDGDGLTDNVDKCPDKAGPKENKGCPDKDRDKDTVVDRLDKCPDVPGLVELKGCPKKISVVFTKKEIKILQKIEFAFNRAKIRRRSYPILNQVVSVMKSRPELRIRVEGHTDNVGKKDYNLKLSRRRAAAVMHYLVHHGGIKRSRLTSRGYGMSQPLVPNTTKENRAKNRRVQFTVLTKGSGVRTK